MAGMLIPLAAALVLSMTYQSPSTDRNLAEQLARSGRTVEALALFEWIVAEQKVAWLEPRDADVYGWADGVLVHFQVRGGRMCTWTQRAVSEATARDRVAATPVLWQSFAQRNAELAVRLRDSMSA